MKRNIWKIGGALAGLLLLLCVLCQPLARPAKTGPEKDRFAGFQLCYEEIDPEEGMVQDRAHWTVYGSEELLVPGMGRATVERRVLVGQYDAENERYEFPGMEGLNAFFAFRTGEDGERYQDVYSDLADTEVISHAALGDGWKAAENISELIGTAFFGPPLDDRTWNTEDFDYIWTPYPVYQMPDGTIYLTGNALGSYGGVGGFTISEEENWTTNWDGEKGVRIEVELKSVERVDSVEVKAFDAGDRELSARTLAMDEIGDGMTLNLGENAVWAMVSESDRNGRIKRTAHTLDEGASHRLVLLDENGMGHVVDLELKK